MTSSQQPNRRGGPGARRALRAAPLALDIRPVNPGMESGRYKPLTDAEVLKIHNAALDVLENIGLADAIPTCLADKKFVTDAKYEIEVAGERIGATASLDPFYDPKSLRVKS